MLDRALLIEAMWIILHPGSLSLFLSLLPTVDETSFRLGSPCDRKKTRPAYDDRMLSPEEGDICFTQGHLSSSDTTLRGMQAGGFSQGAQGARAPTRTPEIQKIQKTMSVPE